VWLLQLLPAAEGGSGAGPHPDVVICAELEHIGLPAGDCGCGDAEVTLPPSECQSAACSVNSLYQKALLVPGTRATAFESATTVTAGSLMVCPPGGCQRHFAPSVVTSSHSARLVPTAVRQTEKS
jgi:hypothetical protein